jgi:hypothetical protein
MGQFHQHFIPILRQYFFANKVQSQNATREKLCEALSNEKFPRKMLMKLTPGCLNREIKSTK